MTVTAPGWYTLMPERDPRSAAPTPSRRLGQAARTARQAPVPQCGPSRSSHGVLENVGPPPNRHFHQPEAAAGAGAVAGTRGARAGMDGVQLLLLEESVQYLADFLNTSVFNTSGADKYWEP